MWAVHPCPIYDPRNKPGPWFQFRVPYGFEWNRVQLPVPNLPRALEGLRILHVTDFHFHRFWVGFRRTHERWSWARTLAAMVAGNDAEARFIRVVPLCVGSFNKT